MELRWELCDKCAGDLSVLRPHIRLPSRSRYELNARSFKIFYSPNHANTCSHIEVLFKSNGAAALTRAVLIEETEAYVG